MKVSCSVMSFATPWTVAHQAPLSMEFTRQEHRGVLPFPSPGDLPNPGMELRSSTLQALSGLPFLPPEDLLDPGTEPASPGAPALAGGFFTTETPGKPTRMVEDMQINKCDMPH